MYKRTPDKSEIYPPEEDIIKISHITLIHQLQKKISMKQTDFNILWKRSAEYLESFRNDLVMVYNRKIKEEK